MKRIFMAAFAVALTLGAASISQAQTTQGEHKDHHERAGHAQLRKGPGGRGHRPMAMLFRDINLTQEQKDQIRALHRKNMPQDAREKLEETREKMKALREKGDTAELRELRQEVREKMKERHEEMLKEIRAILTPEQRVQFEKNVARARQHHQRGKR